MAKAIGSEIRNEFPIFTNNYLRKNDKLLPLVYLDSAATAQKPQVVIDAMHKFLTENYGTVHRGAYHLSVDASLAYEDARVAMANLVGKDIKSSEVVFTRGTTESLNLIANGIAETVLNADSRIVITTSEHHANLVPWQQMAIRKDCEIAYIPLQGKQAPHLSICLHAAKKLITPNTKVVALAHVGNVLGQVNPLKEVIEIAKNVGALVVIDAAQSISSFDDDLFALGADAVAFSLHKMYGPSGIGVLVAREKLLQSIPPLLFGGGMISSVSLEESTWTTGPAKFEAGTPAIAEAIIAKTAANWLLDIGRERIHSHAANLASLFCRELKKLPGIEVFSPETGNETVIPFKHQSVHAHDLATILDSENIAMRAGHHCAWPLVKFLGVDALVRASFAVYSDTDDVYAAIEAIKKATKIF